MWGVRRGLFWWPSFHIQNQHDNRKQAVTFPTEILISAFERRGKAGVRDSDRRFGDCEVSSEVSFTKGTDVVALQFSAQSEERLNVPNDGEWWAIDLAQAARTYTLMLNVPSANGSTDPLYPSFTLCCFCCQVISVSIEFNWQTGKRRVKSFLCCNGKIFLLPFPKDVLILPTTME